MPSTAVQLEQFGPARDGEGSAATLALPDALAWCRRLAGSRYENFSVLSSLVPHGLRDDFAAVYAFCRCADDLGDEIGSPQRSLELLRWWRGQLKACFDVAGPGGVALHPTFVALRPTIARHALPMQPFDDLISAFEMDQTVTRYDTWSQLLGYCRLSADPVGRLVLLLLGEPRTNETFALSDRICTALQLTNHWQDIRRDRAERNRVYVPREMIAIDDFETRLAETVRLGHAPDRTFLEQTRVLVRSLCARTWPLFDEGGALLDRVAPTSRPVIWLFVAGGEHVLASIASWNHETVLHRPRLSKPAKAWLVARAWLQALRSRGHEPSRARRAAA